MCDIVGRAEERAFSRARLLGAGAVVAALPFVPRPTAAQVEQAQQRIEASKAAASTFRTRLVLLGTAGGPRWWNGARRHSFSAALIVDGDIYVIDAGDGAGRQLQKALEPMSDRIFLKTLRALFFTHLHSDHTVDLPNLLLYGWGAGLNGRTAPLRIFGPGRRGEMEPVFSPTGKTLPPPPIVNPANPTPGIEDMTRSLFEAYAVDINDRMRDNGYKDLRALVDVQDITLPAIPGFRSPNTTPAPEMEPFTVYQDDRVRVTATLVNHAPIWPAFAYRFDTDDGSVVFSGDTSPCANLVRLARGAQILVHEAIVTSWIDRTLPQPRSASDEAIRNHLLSAHTPVEKVGSVAQAAGVPKLVLSHIVPGNATDSDLAPAQEGFSGQLIIGDDLLQIPVTR